MAAPPPRRWTHALLALAILASAGAGAAWLKAHEPETRRRPAGEKAVLVEVATVERHRAPVVVEGGGRVTPSRVVALQPEIRGRVLRLGPALRPGAVIEKGALIAQLDGRDYGVALAQAQSQRDRAQATLELERAQREVAEQEVALFEETHEPLTTKKFALREPQLDSAKADVRAAKASMVKAQLDLSRTRLSAPFDALVRSRGVAEGSRVTETTTLATVVGVDRWWIEAEVPKDMIRFLPEAATEPIPVAVIDEAAWGPGGSRKGRVLEVGAEVVEGGRLVRVLVAVEDPLGRTGEADARPPRLLLGSWVRVAIEGKELDAFELPRAYVHDGNRVWIMGDDGTLDIREVVVAARTRTSVFVVEGLKDGERVITSALPYPVAGMKLQLTAKSTKSARVSPSGDAPDQAP